MGDVSNQGYRAKVIGEIKSEENKQRKEESLRAFEIYKCRQRDFILDKLREEFSDETVKNMRTVTSINLTPRVIDEQASIYKIPPKRSFNDVSEKEQEQIDNLYKHGKINKKLKKSNKYYKLNSQCAIQILPKDGVIMPRVLQPHHYDVIPMPDDPEKPWVYIINLLDKTRLLDRINEPEKVSKLRNSGINQRLRDGVDQTIGDNDDFQAELQRLVWWSAEFNFTTDGKGKLIDPETDKAVDFLPPEKMVNPLGELPFVDVADEKDFEFWIREINNVVPFTEEYSVIISDTSDINRLQGYSQGIISSEEEPSIKNLGPHRILHLPLDPNATVQPSFQFATPSPDMAASLQLLETYLRLFLTSNGLDPKTVSGTADAQRFGSGVERLLAMIEKFDASRDDLDLYEDVEQKVFNLMIKWSNLFQGVRGNLELIPELQLANINDKATMEVAFNEPSLIQTKVDKEDSAIKLRDAGVQTELKTVMDVHGISEDEAKQMIEEIEIEKQNKMDAIMGMAEGGSHVHKLTNGTSTGPNIDTGDGLHKHSLPNGEGETGTAKDGEGHTHTTPNGNSGGPEQEGQVDGSAKV